MAATTPHKLLLLAYDGIQALDLTGPHEVFATANRVADGYDRSGIRYELTVVGPQETQITTESGLRFVVDPLPSAGDQIDTLLIAGGDAAPTHKTGSELIEWVTDAGAKADRLATVCTGTFIAAEAGLLDGRSVTTHWARAKRLAKQYPKLQVDGEAIYVNDGHVWTSAGVTAGIDLALAMVECDLGTDTAQEVARWLVVFLRRQGGQSQFAPTVWSSRSSDGPIRKAQDLIDLDPASVQSVAALAEDVGLSARHFSRLFTDEVGKTPARYLEGVRVAAARQQLEATTDGMAIVAQRCGFGTSETLRRVFQRQLGVSPDDYRRRFTTSLEI